MQPQVMGGLGLALACAIGTNLGGLWKHKGAVASAPVDIRHPLATAAALFRSRWWTIGWLVAALGWVFHVGALALAPLSLAQAVISGGLVLLGVLAERWFGFELDRRQWCGLALVALGMTLLAATAQSETNHTSYALTAIVGFEVASLALGLVLAAGTRVERLRTRHGILLGTAAGLLFGVSDVSIKAVTSSGSGVLAILSPWTVTGLVAAVAAFYASARSLQVGEGISVIASTAAAANALGIIGGVVVFGEPLGHDSLTVVARVAAFLLVVLALSLIPTPTRAQDAITA